jgi:hypothetical protein
MLTDCHFGAQRLESRISRNWWGHFLSPYLPAPQRYCFDPQRQAVITAQGGLRLAIPAWTFAIPDGKLARGQAEVEVREVYSKTEMILSGMPTTSEDRLLEADAYFLVRAWQGEQKLELLQPLEISVPLNLGEKRASEPRLFTAGASTIRVLQAQAGCDWKEAPDGTLGGLDGPPGRRYGRFSLNRLGWSACGRFAQDAGRKNMVTAKLCSPTEPLGWPYVFLAFHRQPTIARMYPAPHGFTAINVPGGLSATAVAIGQCQGQLYFGQSRLDRITDKLAHIDVAPVRESELLSFLQRV